MEPITKEEFALRLDKLCSTYNTANIIIRGKHGVGFLGLPRHLQEDALDKMGLRREIDPVSGMTNFYEV